MKSHDGYDRLMGLQPVGSSGEDGFGDGELIETVNPDEAVNNVLISPANFNSALGNCPGAAGDSKGYGSASLLAVLNSSANSAAPAACASQGASEFLGS